MMESDLADNVWVIFAAYVAAFLPWALISSSFDFISPVWKTVRDTWTEGVLVVVYSAIPVLYILFYIVIQAMAEDFKEMFAAIVALLFSLLYIFRAFWGLWKLQMFRDWVVQSIINLGKLGIMYRMKRDCETLKEAREVADKLFVNDTVIDNQLSSGSCPCYLKYGSHLFQLSSNRQHGFLRRFFVIPARLLFPFRLLFYILKDIASGKWNVKVELVPERPVEVWMNWAVVFASQGLESWIRDFAVARNPEEYEHKADLSNAELFQERQRYFAAEVLASAALQFWPRDGGCDTISPMLWKMWEEDSDVYDGKISKEEFLRHAIKSGRGLPFDARQDSPMEANQTRIEGYVRSYDYVAYSRQLRRIVDSVPAGFGEWITTFDVQHLEWLAIMLNLGANAAESELECDAVTREGTLNEQSDVGFDGSSCGKSDPPSDDDEYGGEIVEALDCRDLAVENMLNQLGLDDDDIQSTKKVGLRGLCAFPLPESSLNVVAKCNRLVMRIGEVIDVWCALEAGRQLIYLKGFGEPWDVYCHGCVHGDKAEDLSPKKENESNENACDEIAKLDQGSQNASETTRQKECERLFEAHFLIETTRCMFQLSELNPRYWHIEQTISFMGYRMEFVRTELGTWKKRNEGSDRDVWETRFGKETEQGLCMSARIKLDMITGELRSVVLGGKECRYLRNRSVQVRVIWEIQGALEEAYRKNKKGPDSVELMMLCVLSFPSLSVTVEEGSHGVVESVAESDRECAISFKKCWESGGGGAAEEYSYKMVITPECGPQKVAVVVNVTLNSTKAVTVGVQLRGVCEDAKGIFMWEWWRDSFTARLESFKKWQSEHEFGTATDVTKSMSTISGDIQEGAIDKSLCPNPCYSWSGWLPFRTSICRFELESPQFLWEHKIEKRSHMFNTGRTTSTMNIPIRTYCCASYGDIQRQQLRNFNLVVREMSLREAVPLDELTKSEERSGVDRAVDLLKQGPQNPDDFSRAMTLLEAAVTESQDIDALEVCVDKLVMEGQTQDVGRALNILSNYLSNVIPRHNMFRRSSNDKHDRGRVILGRVKQMFKKILRKDGFSGRSAIGLSSFIIAAYPTEIEDTAESLRALETLFIWSRNLSLFVNYLQIANCEDTESSLNMTRRRITTGVSAKDTSEAELGAGVALYRFISNCYWRIESRVQGKGCKNYLAMHLHNGAKGVEVDAVRAKELYEDAIKEGRDIPAMFNLAVLLEEGAEGVERDEVRAKSLYEEAVSEGRDTDAMNRLAMLLENGAEGVEIDAARAKELYEDAINEGRHISAMHNLAMLLEEGAEGVEIDRVQAKALYEEAVSEGRDTDAMNRLAMLLENGAEGVEVDAVRAKELYEDAINEGRHTSAMFNLAMLLENGAEGVEVNGVRAKALYEEAIREGRDTDAMYRLALLLQNGAEGVPLDAVRAKELYEDAIEEGRDVDAMKGLADLLEKGADGVIRNEQHARELRLQAEREEGGLA